MLRAMEEEGKDDPRKDERDYSNYHDESYHSLTGPCPFWRVTGEENCDENCIDRNRSHPHYFRYVWNFLSHLFRRQCLS